jgi:hypothetical protein
MSEFSAASGWKIQTETLIRVGFLLALEKLIK